MRPGSVKVYRPLNPLVVDESYDSAVVMVRRVGSHHPTAVEGCKYTSEGLKVAAILQKNSPAEYSVIGIKLIEWVDHG